MTCKTHGCELPFCRCFHRQYPSIPMDKELLLTSTERGAFVMFLLCLGKKTRLNGDCIGHVFRFSLEDYVVGTLVKEGRTDIDSAVRLVRSNIEYERVFALHNQHSGFKPIHATSKAPGAHVLITHLLKHGQNPNEPSSTKKLPLFYAITNSGTSRNIIALIEGGAFLHLNVDEEIGTALHLACSLKTGQHTKLIKYLIHKGADVNALNRFKYTPLHHACENGKIEIVKYLIEKGADVNALNRHEYTPLHFAIRNRAIEIVKYLIKKGTNVNTSNHYNETPLHFACRNETIEIIKNLIKGGTYVDATDFYNETPLHNACETGKLEIVENLIKEGAYVDATDFYNETPLHNACENGTLEIVKYLIEKRANVNALNRHKYTPLHYACKYGKIEIVKFLIKKGGECQCDELVLEQRHSTPLCLQIMERLKL